MTTSPLLLALTLATPLAPADAPAAATPPRFRFERPVVPGGPGPNRLEVDVPLLAGAAPGLADLRLYRDDRSEVPYLLVPPARAAAEWRSGPVLAIQPTRKESGFELDLGEPLTVDALRLEGLAAPFLKRYRLEGSGDRARWTLLVGEGSLFHLPDEELRLLDASFFAGPYRWLRLTWDDRSSARLGPPARAMARLAGPRPAAPALTAEVDFERRPSEPGRSRYRVRLPGPHLPVEALLVEVGSGNVLRPAVVSEARLAGGEMVPHALGRAVLRRAERGDLVAQAMRVPLEPPVGAELELVVDDGVNPPLEPAALVLEIAPQPWIYFESDDPDAPVTARFGSPALAAPRYDLEALRPGLGRVAVVAAAWGERRDHQPAASAAAEPELPLRGAPLQADRFRFHRDVRAGDDGLSAVPLDVAVLAHARADLADLRIDDGAGRQVPYLLERRDEPLEVQLGRPEPLPAEGGDRAGRATRYRLRLPFADLPRARLVLGTAARVFERQVELEVDRGNGGRSGTRLERLAVRGWRNVSPEVPAPEMVVDLPARLGSDALVLTVHEGDNQPLPLEPARLLLEAPRLRFFHARGLRPRLLYGDPELGPPQYDLELLARRLAEAQAAEVGLGPESEGPGAGDPRAAGRRIFWVVLVAAVVVLLALLARLLGRGASG